MFSGLEMTSSGSHIHTSDRMTKPFEIQTLLIETIKMMYHLPISVIPHMWGPRGGADIDFPVFDQEHDDMGLRSRFENF